MNGSSSLFDHASHLFNLRQPLNENQINAEEQHVNQDQFPSPKASYLPPLRYLQDDHEGSNQNIYAVHDDAYSTIARALLFKSEAYSKNNYALYKILSTSLTFSDQKCFADAHIQRAIAIPTFRERGESPVIDLVRRIDAMFGEILLDIHADESGNVVKTNEELLIKATLQNQQENIVDERSTISQSKETSGNTDQQDDTGICAHGCGTGLNETVPDSDNVKVPQKQQDEFDALEAGEKSIVSPLPLDTKNDSNEDEKGDINNTSISQQLSNSNKILEDAIENNTESLSIKENTLEKKSVFVESRSVSGRYLPVYESSSIHESSFDRIYNDTDTVEAGSIQRKGGEKLSKVKSQSKLRRHLMNEINTTNELLARTDDDSEKRMFKKQLRMLMEEFCALNSSSKSQKGKNRSSSRLRKKRRAQISDRNVIFELEAPELVSEDESPQKSRNIDSTPNPSSTSQSLLLTRDDVLFIDIVAPIAMNEGFTFKAVYHGFSFFATVPKGGVAKGEIFTTRILKTGDDNAGFFKFENAFESMNIPLCRWRDGLLNIIDDPLFCFTLCCPHIVLTQLSTRMRFIRDKDLATQSVNGSLPLVMLTYAAITLHVFMFLALLLFDVDRQIYAHMIFVATLDIVGLIYFTYSTVRIRKEMRQHFAIRGNLFKDIFLAIFCNLCVISQMGRHTAEYDTFTTKCLSETGLPRRFSSLVPAQEQIQHPEV